MRLRQTLAQHDAGAFARRIQHGGGLGVVVEARLAPVVHQHGQIEIVGLDARSHWAARSRRGGCRLPRACGAAPAARRAALKVMGAEPGGPDRHFCRPAEAASMLPGVDREIHAAQRGGGVDVQQAVVAPADRADVLQRLGHGGGGVAVHQGEQLGPVLFDGRLDRLGREHRAPFGLDAWLPRRRSGPRSRAADGRSGRRSAPAPCRRARSATPAAPRCPRAPCRRPGTTSGSASGTGRAAAPWSRSCRR